MNLVKYTINLIPFLVAYLFLLFLVCKLTPSAKYFYVLFKSFTIVVDPFTLQTITMVSILSLIILSVYRMIRLIGFDTIFTPYRNYIKEKSYQNGEYSIWGTFSKLVACPWCLSIWLVPISILLLASKLGLLILFILSVSGVSTLIHSTAALITKKIPKD